MKQAVAGYNNLHVLFGRFVLRHVFIHRDQEVTAESWNALVSSSALLAKSAAEEFISQENQRDFLQHTYKIVNLLPGFLLATVFRLSSLSIALALFTDFWLILLSAHILLPFLSILIARRVADESYELKRLSPLEIFRFVICELSSITSWGEIAGSKRIQFGIMIYYLMVNTAIITLALRDSSCGKSECQLLSSSAVPLEAMVPTLKILSPLTLTFGWIGSALYFYQIYK